MAYVISPVQIAPTIPVQNKLFKEAFVANYRKARLLQRDSVFWFTSSRNYRFLTGIAFVALLVMGAAICQLKGAEYSSLFVHRSGANFVWALTTLLFCAVEFARIYRRRDGYWTWEVGCAACLAVAIVISSLALANNIVGTIDLAPGRFRAEQTTPWPFYVGGTTARFPDSFVQGNEQTTTARTWKTVSIPQMVTGFVINEWDTFQWSTWRKAVFVLYCFCTVAIGCVLILGYLPYVFFKFHEYKLGYGRRMLSNSQVYDVTKNAYRAYKAAVANREKYQEAIENAADSVSSFSPEQEPGCPSRQCVACSAMPPPAGGFMQGQAGNPPPLVLMPPAPPSSPSATTESSGNFKRAFQYVKPKRSAWFPLLEVVSSAPRPPPRSTYHRYDDDYSDSYYYYYDTPSYTNYGSDYYGTGSGSTGGSGETGSRSGSGSGSGSGSSTGSRPRQYRSLPPRTGDLRRARLVPRPQLAGEPSIASVTTSNEGTFTEYIPATDYTDRRVSSSTRSASASQSSRTTTSNSGTTSSSSRTANRRN